MRNLLVRHPQILGLIGLVVFAAVMLTIKLGIAPYVIHNYGLAGLAVWGAACFGIAVLMERRRH